MLTLQVRKGFEGSNPSLPAAQGGADRAAVSSEIAWAAGFFEGEGTISGYPRRDRPSRVVQLAAYESADHGGPHLLERFRRVMGGGSVVGPYRGRLFHWTTKRVDVVASVTVALWADLSTERRSQFTRASRGTPRWEELVRTLGLPRTEVRARHDPRELSWAAGLFDGEGSIAKIRHGTGPPRLYLAMASNAVAPHSAPVRFHRVVGVGSIRGPRYLTDGWSRLPQWRWEATSFEDAQAVIGMLWNALGAVKRAQARAALDAYAAARGDRLRRPRASPRGDAAPARRAPSGRSTSSSRAASATRPRRAAARAS